MNKLLKDVMMDAFKKVEDERESDWVTSQLFFTILKMMEYMKLVSEEGLLSLEEACKKDCDIPELKEIVVLPIAPQLIVDGRSKKYVTEALVTKYWAHNPQGKYAMANYIAIRAFIAMAYELEDIYNWCSLQPLLTACIPNGYESEYESYKLKHFPQFVIHEQTPKEELMESRNHVFDERDGYIATLSDKLENAIKEAPVNILKQVIETLSDKWELPVVIKCTSNEVREKLFSCMTKEKEEELCNFAVCMGPVLMSDALDAFTCMLLEIIECKSRMVH